MERKSPYYEVGDTIYQSRTGREERILSILAHSKYPDDRWADHITATGGVEGSRMWFYEEGCWYIKQGE